MHVESLSKTLDSTCIPIALPVNFIKRHLPSIHFVYAPQFDATAEHITDINSALTITGWRSADELDSMSTENKRNTLIVELLYHSSLNTQQLQAKQNTGSLHSLTGMTAIFYFLYTNNIRSIHDLRSMSDHDQRHALIVDLQNKLNKDVSELQGMSDRQLVVSGADFYRKVSKTIFGIAKCLVRQAPHIIG